MTSSTITVQSSRSAREALANYRDCIHDWIHTGICCSPEKRKAAEAFLSHACDELLIAVLGDSADVTYIKDGDDYWVVDWRTSTHKKSGTNMPPGLPIVNHIDDLIVQ
jgi:hypothetical protein